MTRGRRAAPSPSAPPSMHGYSDRINHAFAFAAKYYGAAAPVGVGMDYLAHPANVAVILARYGCEQVTIVGGILHHVLEEANPDHRPTLERKIGDKFGPVALAIARDALEPKYDRRGMERPWLHELRPRGVHEQRRRLHRVEVVARDEAARLGGEPRVERDDVGALEEVALRGGDAEAGLPRRVR